jgi:hypothetical protein
MTISLAVASTLILLAVLAEAATEQIKDVLPTDPSAQVKRLIALGVSLGLAFLLQISLFADATGTIQIAGIILAGLLCSRGSNYVHDLYGKISDNTAQDKAA